MKWCIDNLGEFLLVEGDHKKGSMHETISFSPHSCPEGRTFCLDRRILGSIECCPCFFSLSAQTHILDSGKHVGFAFCMAVYKELGMMAVLDEKAI